MDDDDDFKSDMDFFAIGINHQCPKYAAYRADPEAVAVNAFSLFLGRNETVCFSTVLCVIQSAAEGREGWSTRGGSGPVKTALVSPAGEFIDSSQCYGHHDGISFKCRQIQIWIIC